MSAKGKTLGSQAQNLVSNLLSYFEREKLNRGSLISVDAVQERVSSGLGISLTTVKRIKARRQINSTLSSPGKKRPRKKTKSSDLPEPVKMSIRSTLYEMYAQEQHVTLQTLNSKLRENYIVLSNSSLNRVLHDIGFKYKKEGNRRALVEKASIASTRIKFMKAYKANMVSDTKRKIIFLDETWIFSKGNPGRSWQNDDLKSVRKPEGFDGKRFVVVHAGSDTGFVPDASLLFASKSQKEDYHGEMTNELFLKWIQENLINNLEEPSLIIMDNAAYHSALAEKTPNSSWNKTSIIQWLIQNNIEHEPTMFKVDLLALVKCHKKDKRYLVDELLQHNGHEVLRLPPYHCEFNAIELVWAHAKQYYNKHIGRNGYGDDKVIAMWEEALQQCTEEFWRNCVQHTENLINTWYEREKMLDVVVDELIIEVNGETSSSDESDSD